MPLSPLSPSSLSRKTIAIVVCSGFEEKPFVALQKRLTEAGAVVRIVSRDNGITNGWAGKGWGLSYPVDALLAETLAVDYDALVIPHGERHSTLLAGDAHGKRLVNAFLREDVATLAVGSGVEVVAELGFSPNKIADEVVLSGSLVTAPADAGVEEMIDKFALAMRNSTNEEQAA